MELLTFVYMLPVRLESEMKTRLGCVHPASDGCFRKKMFRKRKKKKVTLVLLEETDLRPTEIEKMRFLGELPLVAY